MKKKIFMSVSALTVVSLATFTSYKTLSSQTTMADLILNENIEAISADESETYFIKKCYINENEKGFTNSYICPKGTSSQKIYDCPKETKTVNPYSQSAFCVKK